MKNAARLLLFLLAVSVLAGCAPQAPQADIAATTLPVYEFTSHLCRGTDLTVTQLVTEMTYLWEDETVVCIVDSAFRPMFSQETDYTVSVYTLDTEAFAAGQASDSNYSMDTLWGYSKSGPAKDKYGSLVKVASASIVKNEKTDAINYFDIAPVQ